jgi:hypothetical protein
MNTSSCKRDRLATVRRRRLKVESAGVAASLGGSAAGGGLEPLDELLNGEGLRKSRAGLAAGRGSGRSGGGLSGRGSSRLSLLDGGRGGGGSSAGSWGGLLDGL